MMNIEQRNVGIDILRAISMLMIAVHHVLLHGSILAQADPLTSQYRVAWFMEITCFCAVNVYGMISGYVGYGKSHHLSRFLQLYFQVIFYTMVTTMIFHFIRPELVTGKIVLHAIFPFAFDVYWYYTGYFCLFFLMPFLDRLMEGLTRKEADRLMLTVFIIFCVVQTIFNQQFSFSNNGYSFLWLAIMYLAGTYIKKYDLGKGNGRNYLIGYFLCVLLIWFLKIGYERIIYIWTLEQRSSERFINYTSPFVALCAVCLVIAFKEMKKGKIASKIAKFLASVSFDVYLFHDAPLVRDTFILGAFSSYLFLNPAAMMAAVLGTALAIWLIGSLIGRLRILIFSLFRMNKLCDILAAGLENLTGRLLKYNS